MDTADHSTGQAVTVNRMFRHSSILLQFPVEFSHILQGKFSHRLVSQVRLDAALDIALVAFQCGGAAYSSSHRSSH